MTEVGWPQDADALDAMQLRSLHEFLPLVARRHPHYRAVLAGVDPRTWDSLEAIDALPVTTKEDLAADPDAFRLRTEDGGFPDACDVIYTSGTTGSPVPIHQSAHDYRRILFAQRRMAEIRGIGATDTIANLFPLAPRPNGSWLRVNDHALAIGARLVAGMGGPDVGPFSPTRRLPDVARIVASARPTILWGVGSFLRRFLSLCEELGLQLPAVRMVVASGEALEPTIEVAIRQSLAALGAPSIVVSPGFGASELQCSLVPCREGGALHNPAPELFLLQTIDESDRTCPNGQSGRLVVTHLDRTGTVLLRYALGDVVTLERGPCDACGRVGERMVAHHGRGDTRVKIRGQLVDLAAVSELIGSDRDVAEHAVQMIPADRNPDPDRRSTMDVLRVVIAVSEHAVAGDVATRISRLVHRTFSVRPDVVLSDRDAIYSLDDTMKPARVTVAR